MAQCSPWTPSPTRLLGMTDDELAAFEDEITTVCAEYKESHWLDIDSRVLLESKGSKYSIKFNNPRILRPEFLTQSYIYDYAKRHKNGPRIPQALHYFETQEKRDAFLVMEYIQLGDDPTPDLAERTAKAIKWLSEVPPPSEDVIGPIGGGRILHSFFKYNKAPLDFSSVDALERYMNEGRKLLPKLARDAAEPITIINDPLIFTQSDIHVNNFGVDKCGNTVLLDFGQIGRLPLSFAKYTMESHDSFVARVAKLLRWPDNPYIELMANISSCLWMASNPTLGLDEDGRPQPKRVKPRA